MEITNIECSEDPMPYYRSLREKYSSGYLVVPTIVAGTCNTEFEVITGMNLEFFGPGEYPYKTILKETTCESMAYNMRELGYKTHTIHNNKATFYSRHKIFSQLGFDTFTSIENMCDVEETPNGWAKDNVLVKSITDCLDSSEEKDLIYTVSVQCHGVYTTVLSEEETKITVSGLDDQAMTDSYNYYVNMVKEVDDVIRNLTETLSKYDEDIVLVMYGDHIPGLNLSDDVLESNNIYTTQYVIWDNMGLKKQDMEITSYQLAAEVFNRLNIHEGNIFKFHQENASSEDQAAYQSKFYDLQYDMLYGDRNVYGGVNPFKATKIQYGVNDIIINKISFDDEFLYIEGKNFNDFSNVFIGDEREDCELISSTLLKVEIKKEDIEEGSEIVIQQRNSADKKLRESEPFLFLG
jgi:phosphoglycerol transferase MdoB-like AlkP superfamily enzyme